MTSLGVAGVEQKFYLTEFHIVFFRTTKSVASGTTNSCTIGLRDGSSDTDVVLGLVQSRDEGGNPEYNILPVTVSGPGGSSGTFEGNLFTYFAKYPMIIDIGEDELELYSTHVSSGTASHTMSATVIIRGYIK